jgi:hypothetical protein
MTPEEIKSEMLKIKIPWFIKLADKFWFNFGRYAMIVGVLSFVPLGIIYNKVSYQVADQLWSVMIGLFLFLMFGIGGLMLVSHLIEDNFVKKQAKRLGITSYQWNIYAGELKLMSFKK